MSVGRTDGIDAAELTDFNPTLVTLWTDVADAVDLMLDENVGALPVVGPCEDLVGMVTASALMNRVAGRLCEHPVGWLRSFLFAGAAAKTFARLHGRHVSEIVDTGLGSVSLSTPVPWIAERLAETNAERLPVCTRGKVIGVITRAIVLRAMVGVYRPRAQSQSDLQIIRQIDRELGGHSWMPRVGIEVSVENGIAELVGTIFEDGLRYGIRAVVENVPGVLAVRDHLRLMVAAGYAVPSPDDVDNSRDGDAVA
jgi:CBS domain-containing protein